MALSLQLGFADIPNSITNPNVSRTDAIDVSSPMAFLTFIKLIRVSYEPDVLQDYYSYYIKTWNNKTNAKEEDDSAIIRDRYRDFLKDITLNHTTPEEKQFLSKIDFNDPLDLDVALGFYGKKLRELAQFYNNKRNDAKFSLTRNKLIGTNFGLEKNILELTLSHLRNLEDGKMLFDYDTIKSKIEVEIEELYDTYPDYLNQTPDPLVYDKKDLDYGYNIFLRSDEDLIAEIFAAVDESVKAIKEVDQLFENKRNLTRKYTYTDFYYLSTGATISDTVSGLLFHSDNPIENFLNRNYPTTASTQQTEYLQTPRDKGFFRPSNVSIILIDGATSTYTFNTDKLQPNSLYFFPDPTKIGANGSVITFIVDDSFLSRNYSSGAATNQPNSTPHDTKYYGYVSKLEPTVSKYLDNIFDSGFIEDIKYDINNNLFGLFKNDHRFRQTIKSLNPTPIVNMIFNGYEFYDNLYGLGYSNTVYTLSDFTTFNETKRSGLSTNTGSLTGNDPDLTLYFGYFTPYNELIAPSDDNLVMTYEILEGAYIVDPNNTPYADSKSSDLSSYETDTGAYYYTDLIEGGLHDSSPVQRALWSLSSHPEYPVLSALSANITEYLQGSALNVVDGGYLNNSIDWDVQFQRPEYYYDDTVINSTQTITTSSFYIDDYETNGTLMIRNAYTRTVLPLLQTLPYISIQFPVEVAAELDTNIIKFEVTNDILIIETPSYLSIHKIDYADGAFNDPRTTPVYVTQNTSDFDKVSNRFKVKYNIYYCKMAALSSDITVIYPEIYKFDTLNFKSSKIFPSRLEDITDNTSFFSASSGNVRYVSADAPTITYNSRNNLYNISCLLKDQNNMPCLHEFDYHLHPNVEFLSHNIFNAAPSQVSNVLTSLSTLTIFLSSGGTTSVGEELVV
jgi:hypothetical protein